MTKKKALMFYDIKVPSPSKATPKKWLKIGTATLVDAEHGEIIACHIEVIPLEFLQGGFNWNGEFFLMPARKQPKEKEEGEGQ